MHRPVLLDLMDLSWQRKKEVGRRMEVILEVTHVIHAWRYVKRTEA